MVELTHAHIDAPDAAATANYSLPPPPPSPAPQQQQHRLSVTEPPSRRQHVIGIILVVSISFIWVASSEFIQFILGDSDYSKPYMLTYICVSMFSLFLLGFVKPSWRDLVHNPPPDPSAQYLPVAPGASDEPGVADEADALPPAANELRAEGAPPPVRYPIGRVIELALLLTPFFFLCNWSFNDGLMRTSVASSSTISTLASLFTLGLGAITGIERFTFAKLFASVMSIAGVALIMAFDKGLTAGLQPVAGDAESVLSAVFYSIYTLILKYRAGPEGAMSVAMVLAFLGLFTFFAGWPLIFVLNAVGWEKFEMPSKRVALMLIANAIIGTVLSDFLWAMSVVLTTPLVTTLSLSLTVPLSLLADVMLRGKKFSLSYLCGAVLVCAGFFLVNIDVASLRRSDKSSKPAEPVDDE